MNKNKKEDAKKIEKYNLKSMWDLRRRQKEEQDVGLKTLITNRKNIAPYVNQNKNSIKDECILGEYLNKEGYLKN